MPTPQEFKECLIGPPQQPNPWAEGRSDIFHRLFEHINNYEGTLRGPTLDVASGNATLFRPLKKYWPELLPYSVAELSEQNISWDGEKIQCHKFECDKDRLPLADLSVGVIFFCDVLEHLIVDPVWTLLEFNRVLRTGGHLVISTPNASGTERALRILDGINPNPESHYKPRGIYQRHNREWTVREVCSVMQLLGFEKGSCTTNNQLMTDTEVKLFNFAHQSGLTDLPKWEFGPETMVIVEKVRHLTLDMELPSEVRWPEWLYTDLKTYHQRPKVFPIVVADDYA